MDDGGRAMTEDEAAEYLARHGMAVDAILRAIVKLAGQPRWGSPEAVIEGSLRAAAVVALGCGASGADVARIFREFGDAVAEESARAEAGSEAGRGVVLNFPGKEGTGGGTLAQHLREKGKTEGNTDG